ncbi:MAG: hypothetical protein RLZZ15_1643 [Verrucomicrobiota bacterium]|jgi:hypothetical protein
MDAACRGTRATTMDYFITTFCDGRKYEAILPHWRRRVAEKCPTAAITVFTVADGVEVLARDEWAWSDIIRLERMLALLGAHGKPVIQCDLDVVVEKDLAPLLGLDFDLVFSNEPGGFPTECSAKVGVGACCGFFILRPAGAPFAARLLDDMRRRTYGTYADQVALMHRIAASGAAPAPSTAELGGREYRCHAFRVDGARIGILDNRLVTRDPVRDEGQFANHINIDNVGGVRRMIRYFYEPLDDLPLTCRCGQFGDTRACAHLRDERDAREAWVRGATGWRRSWRRLWCALRHRRDWW